uniref:Integrase catalytic domain-containing protein n=1 Tax=Phlebotomus papatasi TaxID=29031 RepID=A0A1B0DJF0_PHLPP
MTDQTANTVAETFVNRFVCVFGAPIQICSDQGGCFNSATFKHVCKLLNINKKFATPFHPQTDWDTILPMAVAAYNSAVHQSHNMTPHEIIFGEKFDITSFNQPHVEPNYCYDDFVTELRRKLSYSQKIAAERLNIVKEKSKTYYDNSTNPVTFKVGDQVLLLNKSLPKIGESSKLLERRKGPYTVTKIVTPLTTTIKINNKEKTYHNNLLKLYKE